MADETARDLADWLLQEHARLPKRRYGSRRYVATDVIAFVGEVAARLYRGDLPETSWVRTTRFRTTTDLHSGYRMQPADELLSELQGRLAVARGGTDLAPGATTMIMRTEHAGFRTTRNGGYDFQEVDMFLDQVIETLSQGQRPGAVPTFTRSRRGYATRDVDAFAEELRAYGSADPDYMSGP
ncbi:MAG: DivIVA domain-containing protein [Catenulisporales bacterium]|nr:DivIVA domain-containing protein [Catenulisporales bacterium]